MASTGRDSPIQGFRSMNSTLNPTSDARIHVHPCVAYSDTASLVRIVHCALSLLDSTTVADIQKKGANALVAVKPNWVQESHEHFPDRWESVITHPSVVLAVLEGLAELLHGRGTIVLCDAPHTYASFEKIVDRGGLAHALERVRRHWPDLQVQLMDLRRELWIRRDQVTVRRVPLPEDSRGYVRVNLGTDSLFYGHHGQGRYYGADYDSDIVNSHHAGETQDYLLAGTPMACDLFINIAKLKTHKKTGITGCLKNLVGINGDKNWLPHHTRGCPAEGGDEFPVSSRSSRVEGPVKEAFQRALARFPSLMAPVYRHVRRVGATVLGDSDRVARNGNWSGNDTCWRMALDLNRAFLYHDQEGARRPGGRPMLCLVDGILGGEGNGPLCPDPISSGVVLFGLNPAAVDAVSAQLMGYDAARLPVVARAFDRHGMPIGDKSLSDIAVHDARIGQDVSLYDLTLAADRPFAPHFGWRNHLFASSCSG